jgi:aspartate kinase
MASIDLKINRSMAKVTLKSVPDQPGIAAEVFSALGEQGINVELLSTVATGKGRGDISFAVPEQEMGRVAPILEGLRQKLGAQKTEKDSGVSLVSLYGEKLSSDPAFSSRLFKSLAKEGINLQMISQSVSALSFLVDRAKLDQAVSILKGTGEIEG